MAGIVDVDAMLRRITAKQFMEWMNYNALEPFGEFRADVRAAQIASYVFNMAVAVKDRKPLDHFLIKWDEDKDEKPDKTRTLQETSRKQQSWQEQQNILKLLAIAFNAQTEGSKSIQS